MSDLVPISRADFIRALRELGFEGPYSGGNHQYMVRGQRRVIIPNPHAGGIGVGFLSRLLRQAGVTRDDWRRL